MHPTEQPKYLCKLLFLIKSFIYQILGIDVLNIKIAI